MWDLITYPFRNSNGATFDVWEWISNFIPHLTGHILGIYLSMLGLKLNHVSKRGHWDICYRKYDQQTLFQTELLQRYHMINSQRQLLLFRRIFTVPHTYRRVAYRVGAVMKRTPWKLVSCVCWRMMSFQLGGGSSVYWDITLNIEDLQYRTWKVLIFLFVSVNEESIRRIHRVCHLMRRVTRAYMEYGAKISGPMEIIWEVKVKQATKIRSEKQ